MKVWPTLSTYCAKMDKVVKRIGVVLFFALLGGAIISSEAFASIVVIVVLVVAICAGGLAFDAASFWKRNK